VRNNRGSTKVREEEGGGGGGAQWCSRCYFQPLEDPHRSRWIFPKELLANHILGFIKSGQQVEGGDLVLLW